MCMLAYSSWLRQCIAVAQATVLVCRMEMLLQNHFFPNPWQTRHKCRCMSPLPALERRRGSVHCRAEGSPATQKARTVRRLIMMRHADSERPLLSQDHARPITESGRENASQIAQQLSSKGWLPQLIISSTATRTLQTLDAMRAAVAAFNSADLHSRGSLFTVAAMDGMTLQHLHDIVGEIVGQAQVACLMCLGHNKGWEEAVSVLAGRKVTLGTSHAALLEGSAESWEAAFTTGTKWRLVGLLTPESVAENGSSSDRTPLPQPS